MSTAVNESAKHMRMTWGEGGAIVHSGKCTNFEVFIIDTPGTASASPALVLS